MCWTELKLREIQAFHFGEQMFKCPRGGGWGQKMRCEKISDSGGEHVFPGGGGEEPGFTAPNFRLGAQCLPPPAAAGAQADLRAAAGPHLRLTSHPRDRSPASSQARSRIPSWAQCPPREE